MRDGPEIWLLARGEELVAELVGEEQEIRREVLRGTSEPTRSRSGFRRRAVGAATVALLTLLGLTAAALGHPLRHQHSSNWAGYADTAAARFETVSGSWTQPSATCDQPYATDSAFWVGVGGFKRGARALEQIGTETDCTADGHQRAYAWYELVPAWPVKLSLPVRPGDRLSGRVSVHGERVTLLLRNLTTGRAFSRTLSMRSPDTSSAEWIAEAPSACDAAGQCQPLPLTDFGAVHFAQARATTDRGHTGTITDRAFFATELTLTGGGPPIGPGPAGFNGGSGSAVPGRLSADGTSFTVTVSRALPPSNPYVLAARDHLRHDLPARAVGKA